MTNTFYLLTAAVAALFISGCQTVPYKGQAHDVKRKPQDEGIVAIAVDHRPEDRTVAEEKMKSNCGELPVRIVEEGEVVVGQATSVSGRETERKSTEHKVGSLFGIPLTSGDAAGKDVASNSVTTSVKEWQIAYKCDSKALSQKRTR